MIDLLESFLSQYKSDLLFLFHSLRCRNAVALNFCLVVDLVSGFIRIATSLSSQCIPGYISKRATLILGVAVVHSSMRF